MNARTSNGSLYSSYALHAYISLNFHTHSEENFFLLRFSPDSLRRTAESRIPKSPTSIFIRKLMERHLAIIHIVQLQRQAISVIVTSSTEQCPSSTSNAISGNLSGFLKRNAGCFGQGISVSLLNIKTTANIDVFATLAHVHPSCLRSIRKTVILYLHKPFSIIAHRRRLQALPDTTTRSISQRPLIWVLGLEPRPHWELLVIVTIENEISILVYKERSRRANDWIVPVCNPHHSFLWHFMVPNPKISIARTTWTEKSQLDLSKFRMNPVVMQTRTELYSYHTCGISFTSTAMTGFSPDSLKRNPDSAASATSNFTNCDLIYRTHSIFYG
uniref:Uncharacterized protein n=1 Tax=Salix viminalis TaxID=40686 RepID=A0A6N2KTR0_SALVM